MRLILPLIIILLSIGSFIFFTQPILNDLLVFETDGKVMGGIFALEEQKNVIQSTLKDANDLRETVAELTASLNAISDEDIKRLDNFLPDSVNEVQLVTDINNIAKRSGMKIDKVNTETEDTRISGRDENDNFNPQLSSLAVSFETTGGYDQMRTFLSNVAESLRVLDVESLSFSISPNDIGRPVYNVTLVTYWLK